MVRIDSKSVSVIIALTIFFLYAAHNHAAKVNENSVFIYSHGIADTHKQAYNYAQYYPKNDQEKELFVNYNHLDPTYEYAINKQYLITAPFVTFDYPDATDKFYRVNIRKSALAQEVDIERLSDVFNRCLEEHNKDIILLGVSRGASTIVTFVGDKRPTNVQALILESPFDAMENVIANKVKQARLHKIPGLQQLSHVIVSGIFLKYHMNGIRPIDLISKIPKYIPILLICSQEDTLIPAQSTANLYTTLRKAGHPYVHILILAKGKHARIINGPEAQIYQDVVHAFLRHYHLPHNEKYAIRGRKKFKQTRPNARRLKRMLA